MSGAPLQSTRPGRADLASATGETIRLDFTAHYTGPAPGSSAWSITAETIRIRVTVPDGLALPSWILGKLLGQTADTGSRLLTEQCLFIGQDSGRVFSGGWLPTAD